eukprot:s754_g1.t1
MRVIEHWLQATESTQYADTQALTIEPMNSGPLAASSAEAPPWSPNRPSFSPASGETGTPRLLMKTQSTWGKPGEAERCTKIWWDEFDHN